MCSDSRSTGGVELKSSSLDVRSSLHSQSNRRAESSGPGGDKSVGNEGVLRQSSVSDL